MRFSIDLDGVLGDFGARVTEIANNLWPGKIPEGAQPSNWNWEGLLSPEDWDKVWARVKETPYFWEDEKALPGVAELQVYLDRHPKDEVFFVTARTPTVGEPPLVQSANWLSIYGLYTRYGYSVILPVEAATHKKDLFRGLKIPFHLDDYAPTVSDLNSIGVQAYVLDQPWNRYATDLPRVYSVTEYLDTIRAI